MSLSAPTPGAKEMGQHSKQSMAGQNRETEVNPLAYHGGSALISGHMKSVIEIGAIHEVSHLIGTNRTFDLFDDLSLFS
jgi:hypothetical protein